MWFDDTKQYILYGINHKEEGKIQIEKHIKKSSKHDMIIVNHINAEKKITQ